MAQLRDAQTSEIIAEGTPAALVFLAEKIGRDKVLFDNVGLAFDPDALKTAHMAEIAGLKEVADDDPLADLSQARLKQLVKDTRPGKLADEAIAVAESAQDGDRETLPHVVLG